MPQEPHEVAPHDRRVVVVRLRSEPAHCDGCQPVVQPLLDGDPAPADQADTGVALVLQFAHHADDIGTLRCGDVAPVPPAAFLTKKTAGSLISVLRAGTLGECERTTVASS